MSVRNRWRIKVQKLNQWILRLDQSSSWKATREKATCGAHDWKMKSHVRLSILRLSCKKGQPVKDMRKFMFGKKLCFVLPNRNFHGYFMGWPFSQTLMKLTAWHDSSSSSHVLHTWPLRGCFSQASREFHWFTFWSLILYWSFTLILYK